MKMRPREIPSLVTQPTHLQEAGNEYEGYDFGSRSCEVGTAAMSGPTASPLRELEPEDDLPQISLGMLPITHSSQHVPMSSAATAKQHTLIESALVHPGASRPEAEGSGVPGVDASGNHRTDMDPHDWLANVLVMERRALEQRHSRLLEDFASVMARHQGRIVANAKLASSVLYAGGDAHASTEEDRAPVSPQQPRAGRLEALRGGGDARCVDGAGDRVPAIALRARTNSQATEGPDLRTSGSSPDIRIFAGQQPTQDHPVSEYSDLTQQVDVLVHQYPSLYDVRRASVHAFNVFKGASWSERLHNLAASTAFEMCFGILILGNTVVMALQRQHHGLETAYIMGFNNVTRQVIEESLLTDEGLDVAEMAFGIVFTVELFFKIVGLRMQFFSSAWNLLDGVIVLLWLLDTNRVGLPSLNPMFFRLLRLTKLLRLVRVVRWLSIFDPLHLLVKSISASFSVLFWSVIMMVLLMVWVAIFTGQLLEPFMRDAQKPISSRQAVFTSWGTFSRSMLTMFEISLANWAPQCRLLMEQVSESWALFFLAYRCSIGFAVVQVIIAVFVQQTFKVASRDEEVMINEKRQASQAMLKSVSNLFHCLDVSGDGLISFEEFQTVLENSRVQEWFKAIEIDLHDVSELFQLLDDDRDGVVSREEFINGIKAIKGSARASDMFVLLNRTRSLHRWMRHLDAQLRQIRDVLLPDEKVPDHLRSATLEVELTPRSPWLP